MVTEKQYPGWNYEYMKIIFVNCGVKNYMKEDHRSYIRNFCSCEKKAWKKSRLVRNLNPWPLRYRCSALPINKPTGSRSLNWFVINRWKDDDEIMNISKSYMWTAKWRIKWRKIIDVIIFFRLSFRNCKSCVYNCDDLPSYNKYPGYQGIFQFGTRREVSGSAAGWHVSTEGTSLAYKYSSARDVSLWDDPNGGKSGETVVLARALSGGHYKDLPSP